ncbi:uncharacterized protein AMSG_06407 [Thecamonas trahens ATCC 50062]|uniref:FYVE-type domain-containing protein n=1 Tax=Thecamonas trahens ATCC 50062 TaxID=461836 RepID=A0A0L0DDQ0_THETB|nr:hypothetical protein AMSG_06407 [Thecamonas trahens ATCC 50062]KNC50251.1 hypothetical protein AMSG_06407 [Thecamonas trahens ATCC 50062]|eukprot:XP_013757080.1 hypothetical protein AMSG_06407 [Thecamonas trahens ATCC 50062]
MASHEDTRQELLTKLKVAVDILLEVGSDGTEITDASLELRYFCQVFEDILRCGFRVKRGWASRKKDYWSFIANIADVYPESRNAVTNVLHLTEVKTNQGRGRAWFRNALIEGKLAEYMTVLLADPELVDKWYEPEALFQHREDVAEVILVVSQLNALHFSLCAKDVDLDKTWKAIDQSEVLRGARERAASRATVPPRPLPVAPESAAPAEHAVEPAVEPTAEHAAATNAVLTAPKPTPSRPLPSPRDLDELGPPVAPLTWQSMTPVKSKPSKKKKRKKKRSDDDDDDEEPDGADELDNKSEAAPVPAATPASAPEPVASDAHLARLAAAEAGEAKARSDLEQALAEHADRVAELDAQHKAELEAAMAAAAAAAASSEETAVQLNATNVQLTAKADALVATESERDTLRAKLDTLRFESETAATEAADAVAALQASLDRSAGQLAESEAERFQVRAQLTAMTAERDAARATAAELQAKIEAQAELMSSLQALAAGELPATVDSTGPPVADDGTRPESGMWAMIVALQSGLNHTRKELAAARADLASARNEGVQSWLAALGKPFVELQAALLSTHDAADDDVGGTDGAPCSCGWERCADKLRAERNELERRMRAISELGEENKKRKRKDLELQAAAAAELQETHAATVQECTMLRLSLESMATKLEASSNMQVQLRAAKQMADDAAKEIGTRLADTLTELTAVQTQYASLLESQSGVGATDSLAGSSAALEAVSELTRKNNQLEAELEAIRSESEASARALGETRADVALLESKVASHAETERALAAAQDELALSRTSAAQLRERISSLQARVEARQDELAATRKALTDEHTALRTELESVIAGLRSEVAAYKDQLSSYRESLAELEDFRAQVASSQEVVNAVKVESREALARSREASSLLEAALAKMEARVVELEAALTAEREKTVKLEAAAATAHERAAAEAANVEAVKAACLELKAHILELRKSHAAESTGLKSELATARAAAAAAAADNATMVGKLADAERSLSKLAVRKAALLNEVSRLESELELATAEADDVRARAHRGWMDNSETDACVCGAKFTLTRRKHHCRHCGLIYCAECSPHKLPLAGSRNPVRVCTTCHTALTTPSTASLAKRLPSSSTAIR